MGLRQSKQTKQRGEIIAVSTLLFAAGFETTTNLIGNGMGALLRHPDQMAALWDDPSLLPTAVDEVLRWDSPVQRGGMINALSLSEPLRASDLNPIWPQEAPRDRELHISAEIYPARSRNKDLLGFDLQWGRRPELSGALVS